MMNVSSTASPARRGNPANNDPAPTHPKRARIVDVAALAGVSPMTVSNALNAPHRVSDKTRAAVQAAIAQVGYVPSQAARALSSGRNQVLGLPIYTEQHKLSEQNAGLGGFMHGLITELAVAAGHVGYGLHVVAPTAGTMELALFERLIAAGHVDALLLSETIPDDPRIQYLTERGFPFVALGRTAPGQRQCWVDVDNTASMAALTAHLIATGHHNLAYLQTTPPALPWVRQRREGFLRELDRHQLQPAAVLEVPRLDDLPDIITNQQSLEDRPDAYVADNDAFAVITIRTLQQLGVTAGHDLAVTGFNDFPLAALLETTLTTARIPLHDIARLLVTRALDEIDHKPDRPGQLINAPLIIRASG